MDRLGKRLLLCGVKTTREHPYYERVIANGGAVVIVEPFAPNIEYCKEHYPQAEVRQSFAQFVEEEEFDTILWIQGPEHVEKDIALFTLKRFRDMASLVVAECPHGIHPQGPEGNQWEAHRSYLYPEDFDAEWFKVIGPHTTPRENWGPDDNQHLLIASEK
jgi:hypothetical protein